MIDWFELTWHEFLDRLMLFVGQRLKGDTEESYEEILLAASALTRAKVPIAYYVYSFGELRVRSPVNDIEVLETTIIFPRYSTWTKYFSILGK